MELARYAVDTDVPVEKSQAEIRSILRHYGASGFAYAEDEAAQAALIAFRIDNRHYRIYVPLPRPDDPALFKRVNQYAKSTTPSPAAYEQAVRSRWRAACLYIKATLEAAQTGIVSLEQALLSHLLLPNGQTLGQATAEPIAEAYRTGQMPELLPGLSRGALPVGESARD